MVALNKVYVCGDMSTDPYITDTEKTCIANFTVVVPESYVDNRTGVKKSNYSYIKIKAFGKIAEAVKLNCKKGTRVLVEGSVQSGSYEKDGKKVYTQEIRANAVHFDGSENSVQTGPREVFPESSPVAMDDISF